MRYNQKNYIKRCSKKIKLPNDRIIHDLLRERSKQIKSKDQIIKESQGEDTKEQQ